jgi:hypothetical protein
MRQTRPFIVEIRQSRKSKALTHKASIWGDLDLSQDRDFDQATAAKGAASLGERWRLPPAPGVSSSIMPAAPQAAAMISPAKSR